MVLVDTSVWVDHFRKGNDPLRGLLASGHVACHPIIIGELACGHLKNLSEILSLLQTLSQGALVEYDEALHFIERHQIMGLGIGFIDVQLLASSMMSGIPLWTKNKALQGVALKLNVSYLSSQPL